MATIALKPLAAPVSLEERRKRITFGKRQKGAKLWNRFYSTVSMSLFDAERLHGELVKQCPELDFTIEIEKA